MRQQKRYHDQLKLEKRRHFMRKVLFVFVIAVVVVGGLGYGIFLAKLFDVREVNISGTKTVVADDIANSINQQLDNKFLGIKKRDNLFLFGSEKLEKTVLGQHSKLESVEISKDYFHKLNVAVKERSNVGIWCIVKRGQCFYFDKDGVIYDNAPDTSGFLLFNIKDERDRQISFGEKVENQNWIGALSLARQKLSERGFQVRELVIPEDPFDEFYAVVAVPPAGGWKILMSIDTNVESQINSMADFLKQKLSSERLAQLQYIDLRIVDRIYYK